MSQSQYELCNYSFLTVQKRSRWNIFSQASVERKTKH
jgi:hypothetical protein